ncbi:hypothetical protein BJ875DRAFT_121958 [Amylocarpus encephaloides]|uniref:Uncharacterized protein n=1 Tax=Amylocarpus encephaloides TaxID=45428 RepID=A0A9P7YRC3_9HELO|nr:hypothetical protein BJ875DRAFT_121958 [Amylocarpus encephaloides]
MSSSIAWHNMGLLFTLLCLFAAQAVVGDANHVITSRITTVTVSKSDCYTKTINTPNHGAECRGLDCVGPIAQCIGIKQVTVDVPPVDPRCPNTPTKVAVGPCETCVEGGGCRYVTSTVWKTGEASPLPTKRQLEPAACATTVYRSATGQRGFTYTLYPYTETRISLVNCGTCSLVVSELQVPGPGVTRTTTVTKATPFVVTTYACQ